MIYRIGTENAEPDCKIVSLTLLSPDRPDLVLPLPFEENSKASVFTLKDGSHYKLRFTLTISNDLVVGLKYINTVWKKGVKGNTKYNSCSNSSHIYICKYKCLCVRMDFCVTVDTTKIMLGTFSPQAEPYTYELEEETTPSGFFARGNYTARTKVC